MANYCYSEIRKEIFIGLLMLSSVDLQMLFLPIKVFSTDVILKYNLFLEFALTIFPGPGNYLDNHSICDHDCLYNCKGATICLFSFSFSIRQPN